MNRKISNVCEGFSKLSYSERISFLINTGFLTHAEAQTLTAKKTLPLNLAEKFIENAIGFYQLPLGVATNFYIDGIDYVIPMVVEETSVIAAASKTAKWLRATGDITTQSLGELAIGQIQFPQVENYSVFAEQVSTHAKNLLAEVNEKICSSMVKRGGGAKKIIVRSIAREDGSLMGIVHILVATCDAMGANVINQICEYLREPLEKITQEKINLCILSNLTDEKLTRASIVIHDIKPDLAKAIEEASRFAECDPYRAATNNKGVLNGMDAVAIATGNDWRALEAGVHAYAARNGNYSSISKWRWQDEKLIGELIAPVNVGIVGGVTQLHPTAHTCLQMLKIKKAENLARIIAAVGLVQNLGALRALTTEGICRGHMRLHITNLCLAAGAKSEEMDLLRQQLEKHLAQKKSLTLSVVQKTLAELRLNK